MSAASASAPSRTQRLRHDLDRLLQEYGNTMEKFRDCRSCVEEFLPDRLEELAETMEGLADETRRLAETASCLAASAPKEKKGARPNPKRARKEAAQAAASSSKPAASGKKVGTVTSGPSAASEQSISIKVDGLSGPRCTVPATADSTIYEVQRAIAEKLAIPFLWLTLIKATQKLKWEVTVGALLPEDTARELQLTILVQEPSVPTLVALLATSTTAVQRAVIETLVEMLRRSDEAAAQALADLAQNQRHCMAIAKVADAVPLLAGLLENGSEACRAAAASALISITDNKANWATIPRSPKAIPALVALLESGNNLVSETAAGAKSNLVGLETNIPSIAGTPSAIPSLVALLRNGSATGKTYAAATLHQLNMEKKCETIMAKIPDAIPALVALLHDGEDLGKEEAARTLFLLSNSKKYRSTIARTPNALEFLVAALRNAMAKTPAAEVLGGLARNNAQNQVLIGRTPNALTELVALLEAQHHHQDELEVAATALALLAKNENRVAIARIPDAIPLLVGHFHSGGERAKKAAARALQELSLHADNWALVREVDEQILEALELDTWSESFEEDSEEDEGTTDEEESAEGVTTGKRQRKKPQRSGPADAKKQGPSQVRQRPAAKGKVLRNPAAVCKRPAAKRTGR